MLLRGIWTFGLTVHVPSTMTCFVTCAALNFSGPLTDRLARMGHFSTRASKAERAQAVWVASLRMASSATWTTAQLRDCLGHPDPQWQQQAEALWAQFMPRMVLVRSGCASVQTGETVEPELAA